MRNHRVHSTPIRRRTLVAILLIGSAIAIVHLTGCQPAVGPQSNLTTGRPDSRESKDWASPLNTPGLPNAYKVSDDLYRGAQPEEPGIAALEAMGIVTVISLRSFHSDREMLEPTGLAYEHIYMKPWHPEREEVVRFLRITTDPKRTPVFVHCQRGADRTGMMCAIYRIVVEDWTKDEAIDEMVHGGFDHDTQWDELTDFIRALDIDDLKQELD
jgi:tyrosine-protein phosphatase SIW14